MSKSRWPSRTLAIDFDDTIHDRQNPKPGRRMGEPLPGAKETIEALRARGWYILIHSCNRPEVIRDWMQYYQIPYDAIWGASPGDLGQKPAADWYIDDRAICFTTWEDVLEKVTE
jgi:hypothetical protein